MQDFKPLIKNSKFVYLWTSQVLSQLTINIMNFLLLIRLYERTGSSIATSFLWVAYALPAILIGPIAAASVDIFDRRKMLVIANLLQSAAIFVYAFLHETSFFLLYGIAVTYSFFNQFYVPAEAASLPSLVKKKSLPQANGLFFLTQQAALIIGFGFAGLLNHTLGFSSSLYLCSFFLLLAFISVSFLPTMRTRERMPRSFEQALYKFFSRIIEGYKFIKENRSILLPFVLMMGLSVSLSVIVVSMPVLAEDIFRINVNSAGVMIVVPAGIGAAIGTFVVTRLLNKGWRKKRVIETFLQMMALILFIFTFILPEITNYGRIILGTTCVLLIGLSFIGILIPSQTYLQEKTPGGLRGRVFGNYWFLVTVATVFPVIFSGAITEIFGIRLLMFLLTGLVITALFFSKKYGQSVIDEGLNFYKNGE
ncbi:MFS transporter [Patescibacteria group bacterium]|nr:MFS transporter [Patescibacteria group bacterium]MBU0777283.1 MFS transporter [Patescibacteria group bacterium]MBU0845729.1 MFS transporter [Patescibacteria group bacterium]MBU0923040.1 MFS transporter [Patescibacteria group bacterium]MBU1066591.1 MFS transporter [Patescibacteria group bacterium]